MKDLVELSKDPDIVAVANFMAQHQLGKSVEGLGNLEVTKSKLLLEWAEALLALLKQSGWRAPAKDGLKISQAALDRARKR